MALVFPSDADFALALQEPELLSPGRTPQGKLRTDPKLFGHKVLARLVFSHANGDVDLVSGNRLTFGGTAKIQGGRLWTGSTDSDYAQLEMAQAIPSAHTIIFKMRTESRPSTTDNSVLVGFGNSGGTTRIVFYESNDVLLQYNGAANLFGKSAIASSLLLVGETHVPSSINDGTTAGSNAWIDGQAIANHSSTYNNDSVDSGMNYMRLGNNWVAGWAADVSFEWIVVLDGRVDLRHLQDIQRNPWVGLTSANDAPLLYPVSSGAYSLLCEGGAFTLSGQDAALSVARKLALSSGSFTLTGGDIAFKAGRKLGLDSGSFIVTGGAAALKAERKLALSSGSFTLTGQDVDFVYTPVGGPTYTLSLANGAFTFSGQDIAFKASRKLGLDSGSFTLTGSDVTLAAGRSLGLDSGSFALTGGDMAFGRTYALALGSGSFTLTGGNVTFDYSGEELWTPVSDTTTTWTEVPSASSTWTEV